jgi:pimeloyl-ACP methyl ester carboxylesterase
MGRGWKIGIGVVLALAALLGVNALVVDGETRKAEVTVPGGRILDLPGGELQVLERGPRAGSPIVLIHCFTCGIDWWDRMLPALQRRHRVIAVDLLSHDGSEKPSSGYSIPDQAAVVAQALRRLGVRGATLVGHSLGGAVAVALAESAPALVGRVTIVDTASAGHRGSLGFLAGLLFDPVVGQALWQVKPDFATRKGLGIAEEQVVDYPAAALAEYRKVVPGVQTHLVAGAGHSPNVERPKLTAQLVLKFARGAAGATR